MYSALRGGGVIQRGNLIRLCDGLLGRRVGTNLYIRLVNKLGSNRKITATMVLWIGIIIIFLSLLLLVLPRTIPYCGAAKEEILRHRNRGNDKFVIIPLRII